MPIKPTKTQSPRPPVSKSAPKARAKRPPLVTSRSEEVEGIRCIEVVRAPGGAECLVISLAPHYTVVITGGPKPSVGVSYTHHGFVAEAFELNGQLEQVINKVRKHFPKLRVD
jgi:hypothetical protein